MDPWRIIVAGLGDQGSAARSLGGRLERAWPGPVAPEIRCLVAESVTPDEVQDVHAVVLVVDGTTETLDVLPVLTMLEETGTAVMAVLERSVGAGSAYEFAGALVAPLGDDDALLAATLHGMVHRQHDVTRLRREIDIARRFHGGLEGEIARMHEELQLAAMVQREFLPRDLPCIHGVDFAALWRPAHYVSGDIYDIARLDDDHVGVFIADAIGHGVPAALMTMVICRSLITKEISGSSYRLVDPTEVLCNLNNALIRRQGRTTRFATAIYALVDCRRRTMKLAGAGHPPPLLLRADGACDQLETEGGLLGIFPDESYPQTTVDLGIGDRLILYSDGFEQAFPKAGADAYEQRLPTERYRDEFEQLASQKAPTDMIQAISRRIDDQQGSLHQLDDLTMLCMRAGRAVAATGSETPEEATHRLKLA